MANKYAGEMSSTASTVEYKWIINYNCPSGNNVGKVLKSPVFTTPNVGGSYDWQLLLYPNGELEKYKNYFSIFLKLLEDNCECKMHQVTVKMMDSKGNLVQQASFQGQVFNTKSYSWGFPTFVHRDFVQKRNTINGDKLTIVCEIIVQENEDKKRMDVYEKYERLSADFEKLVDDKDFSDVEFTIGNKKLLAHKGILSKRSPIFAAMFRSEMREKHENKVEIVDISHEIFLEMLRYIYAEKVNRIEEIAGELLAAADKYSVDGLKLMCENSLVSNVKDSNALENLRLADRHSVKNLKDKIIKFIVLEAVHIVNKPEFRKLPANLLADVCSALVNKSN